MPFGKADITCNFRKKIPYLQVIFKVLNPNSDDSWHMAKK